jgi:hypothetical protein
LQFTVRDVDGLERALAGAKQLVSVLDQVV